MFAKASARRQARPASCALTKCFRAHPLSPSRIFPQAARADGPWLSRDPQALAEEMRAPLSGCAHRRAPPTGCSAYPRFRVMPHPPPRQDPPAPQTVAQRLSAEENCGCGKALQCRRMRGAAAALRFRRLQADVERP